MSATAFRRCLSVLVLAAPLCAETIKVPADFGTIQEAIAAAETGDVIQVSKGIYAENLLITTPGLTLKGKGATINGRYLANCIAVDADDFSIEGFTLVNSGGGVLVAGPGDGVPAASLHVLGLNASISKLSVRAGSSTGIFLEGTGSIQQCSVDACFGVGIVADTDNIVGTELTVVSRNTVTRCEGGIEASDGPFTIEKNTIEQCSGGLAVTIPALMLEGGPVILATSISKNTVRNCAANGMEITKFAGPVMTVEKNVVEHNSFGVNLEGFTIDVDGNTIDDNQSGGMVVFGSSCNLRKNKVRGNGMLGIVVRAVDEADGGPAGLNVLSQNTVQDNGGDGVYILSSNNEVHDCTIKGNAGDGIDVHSGETANLLDGNKVSDNGHDGIDNSAGLTVIARNLSKNNGGADIAGVGDGAGSVDTGLSVDNKAGDDSDVETFGTEGELDYDLIG